MYYMDPLERSNEEVRSVRRLRIKPVPRGGLRKVRSERRLGEANFLKFMCSLVRSVRRPKAQGANTQVKDGDCEENSNPEQIPKGEG